MSNLMSWRTTKGFVSLRALAAEAGVNVSTAWKAQQGRGNVDSLRAIAEATERLRPGQGLTIGQIVGMEPYEAHETAPTARAAQM